MIEMIYKGKDEPGNKERKLPKNVRQIGEAGRGKKIYLEDYAVTYLHQAKAAVLLGETWEKDGNSYAFIYGAIAVEDASFPEEIWENVYRDAREYFPDSEILGWSMQAQEIPIVPDAEMNRIFKTYFDREDTVLLLYEPTEKEDAVFGEEHGILKKTGGHYIYYDKNKSMQEYMVAKNKGRSVEKDEKVNDRAIQNFRRLSEEKKDSQEKETEKQPRSSRFLYAASTFLVLTILVIGVTMINSYDKMKDMEQTLSHMTQQAGEAMEANAFLETETNQPTLQEETEDTGESMDVQEEETEAKQEDTEEVSALETAEETDELQTESGNAGMTESSSVSVRTQQALYTVKDGDTLVDICRMYYGTDEKLAEICKVNQITDPNHILPGQKIKLP